MNLETSHIAQLACGVVIALIAMALATLTRTGLIGVYGFGLLGIAIVGLVIMWPDRRRFRGKSAPPHSSA